jgi:uncharacterized lipoprotein
MRSILTMSLLALSLAGCGAFKTTCNAGGEYASSQDSPALKVPAGLEAPDTRAALKIPPLAEPERVRAVDEPCLDAPPKYAAPPKPAEPAA